MEPLTVAKLFWSIMISILFLSNAHARPIIEGGTLAETFHVCDDV